MDLKSTRDINVIGITVAAIQRRTNGNIYTNFGPSEVIDHLDNNSCASLVVSSTKKDMNIDSRVKFALKALKDECVIESQGSGLYIIIEPTYSDLIRSIVNELQWLIESIKVSEDGKITSVDPMCYDINSKETDSLAISPKDVNTLCEAIGVDPKDVFECDE